MKTGTKTQITISLITILFFFPSPQENFLFYLPTLIFSIFAIKWVWTKKK